MWEAGPAGSWLVLELVSGSEGEARAKKSKIPSPVFSWETVFHLRSDLEIFSWNNSETSLFSVIDK